MVPYWARRIRDGRWDVWALGVEYETVDVVGCWGVGRCIAVLVGVQTVSVDFI
jgi:hypothetical protein